MYKNIIFMAFFMKKEKLGSENLKCQDKRGNFCFGIPLNQNRNKNITKLRFKR